jgi:hypothetical protein
LLAVLQHQVARHWVSTAWHDKQVLITLATDTVCLVVKEPLDISYAWTGI